MARHAAELLAWIVLGGLSVAAAWATWAGAPPGGDTPPTPAPLPRPPTAAEQAAVDALAARVLSELQQAADRYGEPPPLPALEGAAPDGHPYLPSGLPDNPLAPGVAGVTNGCPGTTPPTEGIDWAYCAAPLSFTPAHHGAGAQSGNP